MDSTNREYRKADVKRWQTMDFVVGYEIHQSNNPSKECERCKQLSGKYPKTFLWDGWHDGCKCYVTSILMDEETESENTVSKFKSALYGLPKSTPKEASNIVKYIPKGFIDYFLQNRKQWNDNNNIPLFISNNIELIKESYNYYYL